MEGKLPGAWEGSNFVHGLFGGGVGDDSDPGFVVVDEKGEQSSVNRLHFSSLEVGKSFTLFRGYRRNQTNEKN